MYVIELPKSFNSQINCITSVVEYNYAIILMVIFIVIIIIVAIVITLLHMLEEKDSPFTADWKNSHGKKAANFKEEELEDTIDFEDISCLNIKGIELEEENLNIPKFIEIIVEIN